MTSFEQKFNYFLKKAEKIVQEHKNEYAGTYYMKGGWNPIRDAIETVASVAGNYFLPGSSIITDQLVSKGAQKNLNSPLGMIAQAGSGLTGGGVGSSFTGIPSASSIGAGWGGLTDGLGLTAPAGQTPSGPLSFVGNMFGGNSAQLTPGTQSLIDSFANSQGATPGGLNENSLLSPSVQKELGLTSDGSGSPLSSIFGSGQGSASSSPSTISSILKTIGNVGPLLSAIHPTTYPGTQSQTQIQNQLGTQAQQAQNNNTAFLSALNSKALDRGPLTPNIDYYTYGSRPEQLFYNDVNPKINFPNTNGTTDANGNPISSQPVLYAKGGQVQELAVGGMPRVHGLNSGPLAPRGIRGGIKNPLIPGGSPVRLAAGGNPEYATQSRTMYDPSQIMRFGNQVPTEKQNYEILRNQMTGMLVPSGNGRLYLAEGGNVPGGQTDNIDAKLSPGEFIIPADVTSSLGDGDTDAGSKQLLHMMKQVRQHKASKMGAGKLPPKAKSPLAYMAGA